VALRVADAVARQAQADGVAQPCDQETLNARIRALLWEPVYRPYRRKRLAFNPATQRDDD
jgi:malate dehydrogenase (oxaloacetate-decarboxylating)